MLDKCSESVKDVDPAEYAYATLAVYELNDVSKLRTIFLDAYDRSVQTYQAVMTSIGSSPKPTSQKLTNQSSNAYFERTLFRARRKLCAVQGSSSEFQRWIAVRKTLAIKTSVCGR